VPLRVMRPLLAFWASVGARDDTVERLEMMKHSFESPITYDNGLVDWFSTGTTVATKKAVSMTPGVVDRFGAWWHREPIDTNDFEIDFAIQFEGSSSPAADQSVALWYVYENYTAVFDERAAIKTRDWTKALEEQSLGLVGYRQKFDGLGIFLVVPDKTKSVNPSVSGVLGNGATEYTLLKDIPTSDSKKLNFRNTNEPVTVRLRVSPKHGGSIVASMKLPDSDWQEVFTKSGVRMRSGGYVGLTTVTGAKRSSAVLNTADRVTLSNMHMFNYDVSRVGESGGVGDTGLLDDKYLQTRKDQMDALNRLTRMLSRHLSEVAPKEHALFNDVVGLQQKVHDLEQNMKTLKREVAMSLGNESNTDVGSLKNDLVGLRTIFMKDSHSHRTKLDAVHAAVKDTGTTLRPARTLDSAPTQGSLEEQLLLVSQQTQELEDTVSSSSSWSTIFFVILVVVGVGVGVSVKQRMDSYEKKHHL